ncbi:MAG: hypothetical protein AAGP08_10180 [Pseudomonadota bacterium]
MPTDNARTIVGFRRDRLIARLKNFLAAWDFARIIDARFVLNWDNKDIADNGPCAFFDIFDEAQMHALEDEIALRFMPWEEFFEQPYAEPDLRIGKKEVIDPEAYRRRAFDHIWYLPTHSPRNVDWVGDTRIEAKRALLARLTLHPNVSEALKLLDARIGVPDAVAVHIRRGDMIWADYGIKKAGLVPARAGLRELAGPFAARYAPDATYHRMIADLPPDRKLVLFSDDPEMRVAFTERYANRVIDVHRALDKMELTRVQRDLTEFLLLSKLPHILGSGSAYATFAAELGGAGTTLTHGYLSADEVIADVLELTDARPDKAAAQAVYLGHYRNILERYGRADEVARVRDKIAALEAGNSS